MIASLHVLNFLKNRHLCQMPRSLIYWKECNQNLKVEGTPVEEDRKFEAPHWK